VIANATPDDVRGKHVIGAVPLYLASLANRVTTVDYTCPMEMRGKDLTADQLDELKAKLNSYIVFSL